MKINKYRDLIRGASPCALRQKWRRWLPRLKKDISDLYHDLEIYKDLVEIVKANPGTLKPPQFFNWAENNFLASFCIGIRRLSDADLRSVSLYRFLQEISWRPEVISRRSYIGLQGRRGIRAQDYKGIINPFKAFDELAVKDKSRVSAMLVRKDLAILKRIEIRNRRLVNKRIAHHAPLNQIRKFPKKRQIEEALELFDRLLAKYNKLITGEELSTFYATPNYDWRNVLQIPWMSSDPRQKPQDYNGPKRAE